MGTQKARKKHSKPRWRTNLRDRILRVQLFERANLADHQFVRITIFNDAHRVSHAWITRRLAPPAASQTLPPARRISTTSSPTQCRAADRLRPPQAAGADHHVAHRNLGANSGRFTGHAAQREDLWARDAGTTPSAVGHKAFANPADGTVQPGATVAGTVETKWFVMLAAAPGELTTISIWPLG